MSPVWVRSFKRGMKIRIFADPMPDGTVCFAEIAGAGVEIVQNTYGPAKAWPFNSDGTRNPEFRRTDDPMARGVQR